MDVAAALREEAERSGERRLLVLAGEQSKTYERASDALEAAGVSPGETVYVGNGYAGDEGGSTTDESDSEVDSGDLPRSCTVVEYDRTGELLGTTQTALVLDCHGRCEPNTIGRIVGTVDGGGLFVLLTPSLADWTTRRDEFDETLAVPPFDVADVSGHFREHLVETLRVHPGIAIVDVDTDTVVRDGLTDPAPRLTPTHTASDLELPRSHLFPAEAYRACRTRDQVDTLQEFETLATTGGALVVESDRGRGKSSVSGLAAACLAARGDDVLVTAPQFESARELFARAADLLAVLLPEFSPPTPTQVADRGVIETTVGSIRYCTPVEAAALPGDPDCVIVDEAAALPVALLQAVLPVERVAFVTTVHGYEGAGRGFSVRFRDHLADSGHPVTTVRMTEPIRYPAGDPVEVWSFRALALDARPPVDQLVEESTPDAVTYRELSGEELRANETLLREVFGLLVLAHYRTEPNDLARLLDAPNISVHALLDGGHPVSVALVAAEGGLSAAIRDRMYRGRRVRGNMIPDVLAGQLRDPTAAETEGHRIMRIATHSAARSRGLGSALVSRLRDRYSSDWLGVGFGATPELVAFWQRNGFRTVHLATSRNDRSGEHSILMLDARSPDGQALLKRHTDWFVNRLPGTLADALSGLDPDVVRAACRATATAPEVDITTFESRILAGIPSGAAIVDTAPRPVQRLALHHLMGGDCAGRGAEEAGRGAEENARGVEDGVRGAEDPLQSAEDDAREEEDDVRETEDDAREEQNANKASNVECDPLTVREERLLVRKVLQCHSWESVSDELDYSSPRTCKLALGQAVESLVRRYNDEDLIDELDRLL